VAVTDQTQPYAGPPDVGLLLWRLEQLTTAQERTAERLDDLAKSLEERYVGRREFDLRVGVIEADDREAAGWRRQVTAGALLLLIGLIANIILSLSRVPGVS
jgi:hypothetical protein